MKKLLAFLLTITVVAGFPSAKSYAQNIPDAPRKIDFAGLTVRLDNDAQRAVQEEIKFLLMPESKMSQEKLSRLQWYFPVIEAILEEEGVPEDFRYLAVVESSLQPDVVSSSNAVGFWQMKAETAQALGLQVNEQVDERKNIYASTHAAATYLKRNNLIYKNWVSTLYSYYLGATGISKLVPAEWAYAAEIQLDGKTDRYIIKTIAHQIAFDYRLNRLRESPLVFVEYKNSKGKSLNQIATALSIDSDTLQKYNTWLKAKEIPADKNYSVAILVPAETVEQVQNKIKDDISIARVDVGFPVLRRVTVITSTPFEPIFYQINERKGILAQAGDDVAALSQKGKIKISKFLDINDLNDKDLIKEGKIYYLEKKDKKAKVPFHTVTEDQTLWDISQMYAITMSRLMKYNRMNAIQRLQKGRVLWLQKTRPDNQPIEFIIDKEKQLAPSPQESLTIADNTKKEDKTVVSTAEKDPDYRESSPVSETIDGKKAPIVILEEEVKTKPASLADETKAKKKEAKTEKKPDIIKPESKTTLPETKSPLKNDSSKADEPEIIILKNDVSRVAEKKTVPATTPISVPTTVPPKTVPATTTTTTPVVTKSVTPPPTTTPTKAVATTAANIHTVIAGETLYSVARTYNVSPKDLAMWNDLAIDEKVKIGQQLAISSQKTVAKVIEKPKVEEKSAPVKSSTATHIVVKGETLFSIAKKYGVTMKEIQRWNDMDDQNVKLGQSLVVKKSL